MFDNPFTKSVIQKFIRFTDKSVDMATLTLLSLQFTAEA